ncbi:MAG: GH25 family lysozyme [Bacteroidia bacterium]
MKKQIPFVLLICILALRIDAQTIMGIDVSSYQGTINWSQVKGAGYTFAFAKATEGITITDAYFVGNEVNGTAAGVVMGAYHFAHPENNSAVSEADYFLSVARPYIKACNLPPVLDLEDPSGGPPLSTYFTSAQLTSWVQTWMTTVQDSTGIAPIIYIGPSNASFVNSSLNTWGLWIDDYNSNPATPPTNIGVWTTWDFKQYSWTGTVPGISGSNDMDMDVFNGSINEFNFLIECKATLADFISNLKSVCPGSAVSFTDKSTTTDTLTGWQWTFTGGTPNTSTLQNPTITYNLPGIYSVKEVVTSTAGKDSVIDTAYINVPPLVSLPVSQGFQSPQFPPAGWYLNIPNPGDSIWELCTYTGSNSTQCMYFPANCGTTVNISGEKQQLYTPDYSFATAATPKMWFDVAYEPSSVPDYSDTLNVYYSLDCGNTWTKIYSKGGMTLCTTGSSTSAGTDTNGSGCFVPPGSKAWRTDSINLSMLSGKANAMFSFEDRSGWGNIIYMDNINIIGNTPMEVPGITESSDVKVYPNPNNGKFSIEISANSYQPIANSQIEIYDASGQRVYRASIHPGTTQVNIDNKATGVYFYRILSEASGNLISEGKIIIN